MKSRARLSVREKIARNISVDAAGCWLWIGHCGANGYGRIQVWNPKTSRWKTSLAHRVSYEAHVGAIPVGLHIDHLCRVRNCVNPEHLEAVPPAVNNARSTSPSALNLLKSECPQGHPLTGDNVYARPDAPQRGCRECRREATRRWRARRSAA